MGSGLGLAIVRELVQGMDGQVSVASAEDEGTAFQITLAIRAAAKRPAA